MDLLNSKVELTLSLVLILSSLAVVFSKKPIHSALSFFLASLTLATLYMQLSAEFVAVMQILVYAGTILVLFMFMMILFQDAMIEIESVESRSFTPLTWISGALFIIAFGYLMTKLYGLNIDHKKPDSSFGTVQSLEKALLIDFAFPFVAIILIFLVAVVGSLYIAKKD